MNVKIKEYLFGLTPLLVPALVLACLRIQFSFIMVFVVAYLWHFFLVFPDTHEHMNLRQYRFAFVRFIYLFFFKLNTFINRKNFFVIESILRALGPLSFFYVFHCFYGGINFYYLVLGSVFFEACYFTRKTLESKAPQVQK